MQGWKESLGRNLATQMLVASSVSERGVVKMGTLKYLFDTAEPGMVSDGLSLDAAQLVVRDYSDFLENSALFPGCIADASRLPHYKNMIKDAFAVCIRASQDPDLTDTLKQGYLRLCAWQDGVGEKTIGVDFTRINLEADPMKIAELVQQKSAEMENWRPLIEAEQRLLNHELSALGVQV